MQQIINAFSLLPLYLTFIAIALVILPTIFAFLLRYSLYSHLRFLITRVKRLLGGVRGGEQIRIVDKLEQRFPQISSNLEQINTSALIDGTYSEEKFGFFGFSLRCEPIDSLCRILPNLLLAFGLFGTFLGITINLANLSGTITQADINDVGSLVTQLNEPLRGMGIAFITSLIAVACSSLLTVANFIWNTSIAKSELINYLEDYLDNVYLPQLHLPNPMEAAIDRLNRDFGSLLYKLGDTIEGAIAKSFGRIEDSAQSFSQAATTLEQSRFPEKLSAATTDLAIAQNQFSQSSLVLQKSTQSFEHTLESVQRAARRMIQISEEISSLNQKYATLIELKTQNNSHETGLNNIKTELNNLVDKLKEM